LNFPLKGDATIVPLPSSVRRHHITSIQLQSRQESHAFVTRQTLRALKDCPQLTTLEFGWPNDDDAATLMEGQSVEQAVEAIKAVLPTLLKSFDV
jgi:hypothetical protein